MKKVIVALSVLAAPRAHASSCHGGGGSSSSSEDLGERRI